MRCRMPSCWCTSLSLLVMASIGAGLWAPLLAWRARLFSTQAERRAAAEFNVDLRVIPHVARKIHLIVLVHGWLGNPSELGYLQNALDQQAFLYEKQRPDVFFYSYPAQCNDGKTTDGVAKGGSRLATEINNVVHDIVRDRPDRQVSLSFIGNSLGGLYARYALSEIEGLRQSSINGTIATAAAAASFVTPRVFCTTATPHLGVSEHTFVRIPRLAEYVVAHALQPTGRDLFRYTSVVQDLAWHDQFVRPLARFAKRVAYANAYQTDFQVPTATAAFLSDTDSVHRKVAVLEKSNWVELEVETPQADFDVNHHAAPDSSTHTISSSTLAHKLDSLGWHKVFCDVRDSLPGVNVPFMQNNPTLATQETYTSRELLDVFAKFYGSRFHFPGGHTVLVANSKNEAYRELNKAGQPIMDQLAYQMIRDILGEGANDDHNTDEL